VVLGRLHSGMKKAAWCESMALDVKEKLMVEK